MTDSGSGSDTLLEPIEIEHPFEAKWYLNGQPKSGQHWLAMMLSAVAMPQEDDGIWERPWVSSFVDNGFSTRWVRPETQCYRLGRLQDGKFFFAHSGYRPEVEEFLRLLGVAHVFIYRDPRDVAVSQAYHVLHEDDMAFKHPAKDLYREMGDFNAVLSAVILGVEGFPGVMERWELYAPWLQSEWTCKVRYEDLQEDAHAVMRDVLLYGLNRVPVLFGRIVNIEESELDWVVDEMVTRAQVQKPSNFRKGISGDWRNHFSKRHRQEFARTDQGDWLQRLGYEEDGSWV